jgi:putative nucleotidyltransferase with HDIG domain
MIGPGTILKRIEDLPTLPSSVARLAALLQDENARAAEFEEVIRPDPAMTANLLRMANTPFFGSRQKVASVSHAVAVMGTKRAFEATAAAAFSNVIPVHIPGYRMDARGFWSHCASVAILSEGLSRELDVEAPALTFTAGLLHDIGKLVIGAFLYEAWTPVVAAMRLGDTPFVEAEQAVLGTDHTEVGASISDHWDLPEIIATAIRWHHTPGEVPSEADQNLVDLIHAADALAHLVNQGVASNNLSRSIDPEVVDRLRISHQSLHRVAEESLEQIRRASGAFVSEGDHDHPGHPQAA